MAQLRQKYDVIVQRDTEILVVGPENHDAFRAYWEKNDLGFIGLPDSDHRIANLYRQRVNWLKMGRMPAMIVIDKNGRIRYSHYGESMQDITSLNTVFSVLQVISEEEPV